MNNDYPVQFSVDYGDGTRNRLTTLFRVIWIIPIVIIMGLVATTGYTVFFPVEGGQAWPPEAKGETWSSVWFPAITLGILLMILFRQKYPRWVFNFLLEATRFSARVSAYLFLLVDEYPSTDEEQSVHLEIPYPDVKTDLNRWLPLIKWLLAIPHYIVLAILFAIVMLLTIVSWFAIIITGRYPRSIFDFVVGVARWGYRVLAYSYLLTTDRYPPFRMG